LGLGHGDKIHFTGNGQGDKIHFTGNGHGDKIHFTGNGHGGLVLVCAKQLVGWCWSVPSNWWVGAGQCQAIGGLVLVSAKQFGGLSIWYYQSKS